MPNVVELETRVNLTDSASQFGGLGKQIDSLTAAIERLNTRSSGNNDPFKRMGDSASHSVTSMQAASAAIRTVEGNLANNIRAAERFIGMLPGVGSLLVSAFPVVGLTALSGVIFEGIERFQKLREKLDEIKHSAENTSRDFEKLSSAIRVSNEQLQVANDKLDNEIAKLEHRPQNTLKLALDETILSSNELGRSLARTNEEINELLKKREVGAIGGFFTGRQSTGQIRQGNETFTRGLDKITADAVVAARNPAIDDNSRKDIYAGAIKQRADALRTEVARLGDALGEAEKTQKKFESYRKAGNLEGLAVEKLRDQTDAIAQLRSLIGTRSDQLDSITLKQENTVKTAKLEGLKASNEDSKKLLAERQRIEDDAQKALLASVEREYDKYHAIVAGILDKINQAQQKGALSQKARTDYYAAIVNTVFAQSANISSFDETIQTNSINENRQNAPIIKAIEAQKNYQNEILQYENDATIKQYDFEEQKLQEWQTTQLKALDALNAQTVQQKLSVEERKLAIEKDFLAKSTEIQVAKIRALAAQELGEAQGSAERAGLAAAGNPALLDQINADAQRRRDLIIGNEEQSIASVRSKAGTQQQEAVDKAAKAQTQVIQEQYKNTYDHILRQSNDFLSAIEEHTGDAWKRIADNFKKTFLDAFNNVISSTIAKKLAYMITGQGGSDATGKQGGLIMGGNAGGGGGILGALGGLFGGGGPGTAGGVAGTPPFVNYAVPGGSALGAVLASGGAASIGGGGIGFPAANSGTTLPGIGTPGGGGGGGILGSLGGLFNGGGGSRLGLAAGGIALISSLGQKGAGGMLSALGGGGTAGYNFAKLASTTPALAKYLPNAGGIGGGIGGAAAGVGLGLFTQGLGHTGLKGFGESLGGGALAGAGIGFMAGGPVGALIGGAIGAGAGAVAGLFSLFRKSPRDKVKEIVKQSYGIQIDDAMADSIANIAKEQFGNNIPLAISSPQIRQMVALYAQATGNGAMAGSINPRQSPYTVASSGGAVTNVAATIGGYSAQSYGGSIPTSTPGSPMGYTVLKLDGPATVGLLSGVATSVAPSAVQQAYTSNSNRLGTAGLMFQPGLVTR
jgi:hypothetical protein